MTQYYQTKETALEYIELAKGYDGRELIKRLNLFLPKQTTLLELGSGPGTDLNFLKDQYQVTGSDFSKVFLKILSKEYPTIPLLELNAVTLNTTKKFNGIYSNKVLQHLTIDELKKSIQSQCQILTEEGIICHSFWKGEGNEEFGGVLHQYYNEATLFVLFSDLFDVLVVENYTELEKNDSLLLIARKK